MRLWFENVSRRDARLLVWWWNRYSRNPLHRYWVIPHRTLRERFNVVQTTMGV
jgi:hypothetical protein